MTKTYQFVRAQFVPRPIAEVFDFFSDADNLEAITPKSLRFEILTPRPIVLKPGMLLDYRLRLLGIKFYWRTLIETFEPPHRFTDSQLKGPYKLWHHTHEFYTVDGGTLVVDRVRYQVPLGPIGRVINTLFVRRQLDAIFDYRQSQIETLLSALPTPASAVSAS